MIPFPNKKYQIIYADPPWNYNIASMKGTSRGIAERYYPILDLGDIENIPVGDLVDNGVLFLWVTYPHLEDSFKVIKSWGFTYKTVAFTWIKIYKKSGNLVMGCGYRTRANAEIVLLATKGKDYPRRINAGIQQVIISSQKQHSEKPHEIREKIVKLLGDLPRIELFARHKAKGWDAWGNEELREAYIQDRII